MKKEGLWIFALTAVIIVLIPWTVMEWRKKSISGDDIKVRVKMADGKIEAMMLEKYLVGVVAAEMPAVFHSEALKAQAIAARTYAAKRLSQRSEMESGFDVDTTVLTQAWLSDKQMRERWGWLNYWHNYGRIEEDVNTTRGKVLVYEGQYADALFHSSTGRKPTERADEVWSASIPYLQQANSGESEPYRFIKSSTLTAATLSQKLGYPVKNTGFLATDFVILERTASGRVKTVRLFGKSYPGTQLRGLLGLPSTDFEVIIKKEEILIKSYGNGHAVGMSQYGANDLAKKGFSYAQILEHFYPGTKLLSLTKEK